MGFLPFFGFTVKDPEDWSADVTVLIKIHNLVFFLSLNDVR